MRNTKLAAVLLVTALAVPGCLALGGKGAPPVRRHSIDLPSLGKETVEPIHGPIVVRQFASRGRYELRVLTVDAPGRVSYLELDRWAEDPSEAVTTFVRERMASSGRFAAVAPATSEMETDLVLDGALLAFDLVRPESGPPRARVALRLEVTERSTGTMVHAAAYEAERALPGEGTDGLGSATGACLEEIVEKAMAAWERAHDESEAEVGAGTAAEAPRRISAAGRWIRGR